MANDTEYPGEEANSPEDNLIYMMSGLSDDAIDYEFDCEEELSVSEVDGYSMIVSNMPAFANDNIQPGAAYETHISQHSAEITDDEE